MIVDSHRVIPREIAAECVQAVARRDSQRVETGHGAGTIARRVIETDAGRAWSEFAILAAPGFPQEDLRPVTLRPRRRVAGRRHRLEDTLRVLRLRAPEPCSLWMFRLVRCVHSAGRRSRVITGSVS